MGGQQASEVLGLVKYKNVVNDESIKFKQNIMSEYDKNSNAYLSTSRLWDDGIIKAEDLRRVLGLSLVTTLNAPILDS